MNLDSIQIDVFECVAIEAQGNVYLFFCFVLILFKSRKSVECPWPTHEN